CLDPAKYEESSIPPPIRLVTLYELCSDMLQGALVSSIGSEGPDSDVLLEGLMLPLVDHEHCSDPEWWGDNVKRCHVCADGYEVSGCFLVTLYELCSQMLQGALVSSIGFSGSHPPIHIPSRHFSNSSSRVVNGVPVVPHNKYPWQVALLYLNNDNGYLYFICGGSLIKRNWVMTAAHCFPYEGQYWVMLGAHNLTSLSGSEQIIPVKRIVKHPDYDDDYASLGYDIALGRLEHCAELTDTVQLATLPPSGYKLPHGTPCYLSGWGYTLTEGPASDVLLEGLMPVVDHEHCSDPEWWGDTVKHCHVCAGGYEVSGCFGDSGGPLNCPAEDGSWEVHGIASFVSGYGCNAEKKPTVFTRVSAYIAWIKF
ncbi:proproteinase E-like, partial [Ochotona curzoniae]|uniref:proproteinase E-like n=1 Tax=Ochotona curzoniae TaxID=130825 RepID=UPI001B34EE31